jgi:DNA (cytosine-5)-methyltransferase 1
MGATAERLFLKSQVRPDASTGRAVRTVDLYSGCGGLSLGLWEACRAVGRRFESAAAFDSNSAALGIFRDNFRPDTTFDTDVRHLLRADLKAKLSSVERGLRRSIGHVDFLLAGPPCQGFTALNTRTRGTDPRNHLYSRVARLARVLEPEHVIIENVSSVRRETQVIVDRTLNELEHLGYEVAEATVPLVRIGVPQLRRRSIALATTGHLEIQGGIDAFAVAQRDLRWAIGDLVSSSANNIFGSASHPSMENRRRMAYLRKHRLRDLPNGQRPRCHWGDHSYKSMYGRLSWSEPAQTITSGYGSMGQGRYVHPAGYRTLTPHEAARIQFFPDWFNFGEQTRNSYAEAIGNAVPMKLSYAIGTWLLR